MGVQRKNFEISDETDTALKQVAARFPEWSLRQLGNKLLLESCRAILSSAPPRLPTLEYIRGQINPPPEPSTIPYPADADRYEALRVAEAAGIEAEAAKKPVRKSS